MKQPSAIDFPAFRPRFPWLGADLQTIRNTVHGNRATVEPAETLQFVMPDGSDDVLLAALNRPIASDAEHPLTILVHGLTGDQDSFYVRATARMLLDRGYPVLRLNLRGAGSSAATCRMRYHAGRTDDLRAVLAQLPTSWARKGVVLVGWSLGGNCVLKFLGEADFPVPVRAGAAISAPIDLAASSRRFGQFRNRLYHRRLLGQMKHDLLANRHLVGERWANAGLAARNLWDFDDKVVAPWNGWSGAPEYYRVNSALGFLSRITVPTLIVHSLDDPWIPADAYRSYRWSGNPSLVPALSVKGGHVGFHGTDGVWSDLCLDRFLATM